MQIHLTINNEPKVFECQPWETLLRVLRREGYYSVRYGSDTGETGASAILLNGKVVNSDILLASQADSSIIETIEGLSKGIDLHPIQEAFLRHGAIQSGYSTPATILAAKALLQRNPNPTEKEIREAIAGVLDRETGYVKIVSAILDAAAAMRGEKTANLPLLQIIQADSKANDFVQEKAVVNRPEKKVDGMKLVKGNAAFVDDIELKGLLHAKLVTSPHAHARILDIDDSKVREYPGVRAVIHYKNIPRVRYASGGQSYPNPKPYDQVCFDNKVRYVGDRVAAIAADTLEIAQEAMKLLVVQYEVLPAVFDENQACAPGVPVIHDEPDMADAYDASKNISHRIHAKSGNTEIGFAQADFVFEHTYKVHQVQQCPIEPHIAISYWDEDERLVIRTSTQVPFHVRRMVAPLLGLPLKRIRVIKPRIGGGFGVKQEMLIEDIVGHLTIATRKPVRLEFNREEEFRSSRSRHPQTITYKTGVSKEGKLVSQKMTVIGNTGAYATHGLTVQTVTGLRGLSTYNCPNKEFDCKVVYTNIPVPGAYRGYGGPQAFLALESHMEEIAHALGIEVAEFKKKNCVKSGDPLDIAPHLGEREDPNPFIPKIASCALQQCLEEGMKRSQWHRRYDESWRNIPGKPYLKRGLGMALCMHGSAIPGLDMGGAFIKINDDGSFNLLVGATDLGTGSDTILAQIAAEVLGVPTENILVYSSDTDLTPFDTGAYASSTTYVSGNAVKLAAEKVKLQIQQRAALLLGISHPEEIVLKEQKAIALDGRFVPFDKIALHSLHEYDQQQIMATASFVAQASPPPFAAQFAEIEIDTQTGQVTVKKLLMVVDCGVAINPVTATGQIEGGMVQALGYGHCEEMVYDDKGRMVNTELGPYKIYQANEMPEMEVVLIQTVEETGPFGAKAAGEIPKDGVAPAIGSAIYNATGVRIREIPYTPQKVWQALQKAEKI
ncbi:MAG: molybdopterin-dependent oxidoreductase [Candidatus Brocadiae bacterium]|nr:molybdopterin-dependent oxidoreductase [Candidatus Brocadiia bacterium]